MILVCGNASVLKCPVGNHFRVLTIRKIMSVPNCKETWELHTQLILKLFTLDIPHASSFRPISLEVYN